MNTRAIAARILRAVIDDGKSLTPTLADAIAGIDAGQDRAFVQALSFGVLRHYESLDFILTQLTERPIRDPEVRCLALAGLFQLEYMRVKPYAAVAATVDAAKRKAWAKPLLNALLRNYQRRREELQRLRAENPPAAAEHPAWLLDALVLDWGDDVQQALTAAVLPPPMSLRVNLNAQSREAYLERLAQAGIAATPGEHSKAAVILAEPVAVDRLPGFADGWVSVQDEAAQLAASLLQPAAGQRVLDVCAAPGGKTVHLAETEPALAALVAVDVAADRVVRLRENLGRAGVTATVLCGDAAEPKRWWDGVPFDRILLDAPCSGTGVIRRHPDIKRLRRQTDSADLNRQQDRILDAVWPLLAEGGVLLYATCSILRDENDRRVRHFLDRHPDASEWPIEADWGRSCGAGRQILTGESGMDGFFYARLRK